MTLTNTIRTKERATCSDQAGYVSYSLFLIPNTTKEFDV